MRLLQRLNQFPPKLCRLLARDGNRPLTLQEIATKSGVKLGRLHRIFALKRWDRAVDAADIEAIMSACGVDIFNTKRITEYLNRQAASATPFSFLKNARLQSYYKRLIEDLSQ